MVLVKRLTVLDPIDDLLMTHELFFSNEADEDHSKKNSDYRLAWVMRWLEVVEDFYVDTCGMRLSKDLEKHYGKNETVDSKFPDYVRGIFT